MRNKFYFKTTKANKMQKLINKVNLKKMNFIKKIKYF